MRINHKHRRKLKAYLDGFYKCFSGEQYTVFHFVKFFKQRLKMDKDAWIGVSGATGCLEENTKLKDNSLNLKDLFKKTEGLFFSTTSYDWKLNKEVDSISRIIDSGEKEVFKITTESGKVIECSEDHKFFVEINGEIIEKTLKELKIGSKILKR